MGTRLSEAASPSAGVQAATGTGRDDPRSRLVFRKRGKKFTHLLGRAGDCTAQKVENFNFYDLRHCAVPNLADAGVDIATIMKMVGHSSVEMFPRSRTIKAEMLDDAMFRLKE
jgi:integrase